MTATINVMEWRKVDTIPADSLEIGDWVLDPDGNIAEVIDIADESESLIISSSDDYGDLCEWNIDYESRIDLYWLFDD